MAEGPWALLIRVWVAGHVEVGRMSVGGLPEDRGPKRKWWASGPGQPRWSTMNGRRRMFWSAREVRMVRACLPSQWNFIFSESRC